MEAQCVLRRRPDPMALCSCADRPLRRSGEDLPERERVAVRPDAHTLEPGIERGLGFKCLTIGMALGGVREVVRFGDTVQSGSP
jgi:hypothetical protein